ncbi:MAG: DNA mismatch repair protein MutS [Candidatus Aminicenantes bacterium]|nr:DNA mismatch repair protein MutS [Candidatus Aminicenantes bacterium]
MTGHDPQTPMMEQYFRIKRDHPDALLFFRLGDFYEMFYEDAERASRVLGIALTSRQKVPMCGVPHHAVSSYLAKLLRRGHKVAVCEQVEDPRGAKGVVKREVVRVLTPGTAVEVEPEDARESLFIASLAFGRDGWGLALMDLAAGEMRAAEGGPGEEKTLSDELFKAGPREVVFSSEDEARLDALLSGSSLEVPSRSPVEPWAFDAPRARSLLLEELGVSTLAGFGLEDKPLAVAAAGALVHYLRRVRRDSRQLIRRLTGLPLYGHLFLDASTVRNLELVRNIRDGKVGGSLLSVLDETVTSMGGRLLRDWLLKPLLDPERIRDRAAAVEELAGALRARQEIRRTLKDVLDLERLAGKAALGAAGPRDLVALKNSLRPLPGLRARLEPFLSPLLRRLRLEEDDAQDVADFIDRSLLDEPGTLITEGGIIRDGFNAELDALRNISRSGKSFLAELETRERARTGIASLKVRFNKVFGYFLEVTKPNLPQVPPDYIRKQTLVGSERFITPELKDYEEKVLHAEERIGRLEHGLFLDVRESVGREAARLLAAARRAAEVDVLCGLAEAAMRRNYVRPEIREDDRLLIREGRHAVVEASSGEPFIPNDTDLDRIDRQILIITGPNMGGKSTYLRQTALIVILAQMGSFVPAGEASLGIVDRIFTRIGAMDFLSLGQSTFMVEMVETAAILNNVSPRSLVLLDEVGRGTSTFDGLSLAWAAVEFLHEREDIRPKTLFATHYHELTELALTQARIKNCHLAVREWKGEVVFLRRIEPGPSDRSYGLHVAKLAGIPESVLDRAREILFNMERQELDETGRPARARKSAKGRDRNQGLLFGEEREREMLDEIRRELAGLKPSSLDREEAVALLERLMSLSDPVRK